MDNSFRISRLMRIYDNWGGCTSTLAKTFNSLPSNIRLELTRDAGLSPEESPFLAYYESSAKWTAVTLSRLVWKREGQILQVPFQDLAHTDLPENDLSTLSSAMESAQSIDNEIRNIAVDFKTHAHKLLLVTKDGRRVVAEWEPGGPFFGFWNVVRMLIAQTRNVSSP